MKNLVSILDSQSDRQCAVCCIVLLSVVFLSVVFLCVGVLIIRSALVLVVALVLVLVLMLVLVLVLVLLVVLVVPANKECAVSAQWEADGDRADVMISILG